MPKITTVKLKKKVYRLSVLTDDYNPIGQPDIKTSVLWLYPFFNAAANIAATTTDILMPEVMITASALEAWPMLLVAVNICLAAWHLRNLYRHYRDDEPRRALHLSKIAIVSAFVGLSLYSAIQALPYLAPDASFLLAAFICLNFVSTAILFAVSLSELLLPYLYYKCRPKIEIEKQAGIQIHPMSKLARKGFDRRLATTMLVENERSVQQTDGLSSERKEEVLTKNPDMTRSLNYHNWLFWRKVTKPAGILREHRIIKRAWDNIETLNEGKYLSKPVKSDFEYARLKTLCQIKVLMELRENLQKASKATSKSNQVRVVDYTSLSLESVHEDERVVFKKYAYQAGDFGGEELVHGRTMYERLMKDHFDIQPSPTLIAKGWSPDYINQHHTKHTDCIDRVVNKKIAILRFVFKYSKVEIRGLLDEVQAGLFDQVKVIPLVQDNFAIDDPDEKTGEEANTALTFLSPGTSSV